MLRWLNRKRVLHYSTQPAFTTFAASPAASQPDIHRLFHHQKPANPIYPPLTPLQISIGQFNSSNPASSTCQNDSCLGVDKRDFLGSLYQHSRCPNEARELHLQLIKSGFTDDMFLCNTLLNVYVRIGDMVSARKLFDEMLDRNTVTWACLITGYVQSDMPNEACRIFKGMICDGFLPNHYALGSALRACQQLGRCGLELGKQIHGLMSKTRYATDVVVCNVLISMYGTCFLSADYARRVFDEIGTKNSISWNSIITMYSQRGNAVSAFGLFSDMQKEGSGFSFKPNEYTFASLIAAACHLVESGLNLLEQLLNRVHKSGFLHDLYVGSALVSGLSRFGLVDHAKKILEQMSDRNAVSMNGLMVGLVKQKRGEEAAKIFTDMTVRIGPNIDSYVVLLSAFPEFSVLEEGKRKGKEAHAHMIRTGLIDVNVGIGNGLVNMYAKCSAIHDASTIFRLMDRKDSVSWNSIIAGLDQNECFEDAVANFCAMRKTGLIPSNFAMISALSSCASLGWISMGEQIHGEGLKFGLDMDTSVSNALLALYSETGYLDQCEKLFLLMPKHDQVSWNSIIGALSDSESTEYEAVQYFLKMLRAGWCPNTVTFMNILPAVSSLYLLEPGRQIHALILKYGDAPYTAIENALLTCYGRCGEIDDCEKIFSRMTERRDDVSWNSMISGYIHNELLPMAVDLVWLMRNSGQRLDGFTFSTVLSACASVATLERGMEVHACSIRAYLESDVVLGSALVDMYAKCGRIDYASRFFQLMPLRNKYSWNSMISGYARHGNGDEALNLFKQMKLQGQQPDHVTFVGVLSACSHAGLVDEGFKHFKSMREVYGLAPRMEHFSCMVDLLARAGELNRIQDFINKMPMKPNELMWRTVLGACCRSNSRNTELSRRAAEMLLELEPQNAVNYVLVSNMYASGGKWDEVSKARTAMRKALVKKEAGCSWVTLKDGVHVFVAGDKSHPEKDLIYEKLKELNLKMKDAGYVPETKYALYDLETENKEELLSYHSEKIAVAFVLTRKSELPIRIMKNLRVCGDCHTAFKFISHIVGRQIILRDSQRFHHFADGECSCKDYW